MGNHQLLFRIVASLILYNLSQNGGPNERLMLPPGKYDRRYPQAFFCMSNVAFCQITLALVRVYKENETIHHIAILYVLLPDHTTDVSLATRSVN